MKQQIHNLVERAVATLIEAKKLPQDFVANIQLTVTKDKSQGDFASNVALASAKNAKMPPRALAELIVAEIESDSSIDKVEIAGPGFINFFLASDAAQSVVLDILAQKQNFGLSDVGANKKVQIEFVSANPTGPLHVGHGRGAAYGATLATLLRAVGYDVHCEYYVNDAGRQMDILGTSVWLRYLELSGEELVFPSNGYQGDYVWDIAASLHREYANKFKKPTADVFDNVSQDAPDGDKETHIDDLINNAKQLLGADDYRVVFDCALDTLVDVISKDLKRFGVEFEEWFSERSLTSKAAKDGGHAGNAGAITSKVDEAIQSLQDKGHIYEQDGALWFRSTDFGDEKDRVVKRDNGQTTYFASDIAYHMNKFDRGYELAINIWGADHHGYIARVKAALTAMDYNQEQLEIILVQFANLFRNGEKVAMSTRSGDFVTLKTLRDEVGSDAARFFYVMRKSDQHMDFDLDLAKSQSSDNPVYYVQYAHARICSVQRQLVEKGLDFNIETAQQDLSALTQEAEQKILKQLAKYPEQVITAAHKREPHHIVSYVRELAQNFHSWYNGSQFLVDEVAVRNARLTLAVAVQQVIKNALDIIGVAAPEKM